MNIPQNNATALIVDDDRHVCHTLAESMSNWGIQAKGMYNPLDALDHAREHYYNLMLLDVVMPHISGIEMIPELIDMWPDTKVIMMTGYADKEKAIEALRAGAFDFLEKPIDSKLLSHSVSRALQMQKAETDFKTACHELEDSRDAIMVEQERLKNVNKHLLETNKALSVLAQNIELTRKETVKEVVLKFRSLITPIVEKLQEDEKLATRYNIELDMLGNYLNDLGSTLGSDLETYINLSSTEFRVASLVRNGLTSRQIADHLFISPSTVKTHRRNIRKKLGISNKGEGLRSYLQNSLA